MGTTKQVKCYNYNSVTRMLDICHANKCDDLDDFLRLLDKHEVKVFQPPKAVGSGRARKKPETYLMANKWLDQYMCEQNTWAVLKGKIPVKPGYKKYEEAFEIG
jgi:hypothetical protein